MDRCRKISFLLRLAELCTVNEDERRLSYMDEVDALMSMSEANIYYEHDVLDDKVAVLQCFDFDAPQELWRWVSLSEIIQYWRLPFSVTPLKLGKMLSGASRTDCGIKKRRIDGSPQYYIPPRKDTGK